MIFITSFFELNYKHLNLVSYKFGYSKLYLVEKNMSLLTRFHRYTFSRIYKNFVNGEFVEAKDAQRYPVRNPVTQ